MPLKVITVPCLNDNYAFLMKDEASGRVGVVDVPEAGPIQAALAEAGWTLTDVLFTHHHDDHIGGLPALGTTGMRIWGSAADQERLPPLTNPVSPGDTIAFGDSEGHVWDVSGHTINHLAFVFDGYVFTGDSLMALGCGRLFEGTPEQMHTSLKQFDSLPDETLVCSGHEYTAANGRFAKTVEPNNAALAQRLQSVAQARADNRPTVPSLLSEERATNPFLRCHVDTVKAGINLPNGTDVATFAAIRAAKDAF